MTAAQTTGGGVVPSGAAPRATLPPGWKVGSGGYVVRDAPRPGPVERPPLPRCSVATCEQVAMVSGLCKGHYARKLRNGDVFADVPIGSSRPLPQGDSVNLVFPGSCGTCGAGDLRADHADWCHRVKAAAPVFLDARPRS